MPELPEVEFCRRSLSRWTDGKRIVDVIVRDPRSIRRRREDRPTQGHPEGEACVRKVIAARPGTIGRHGKRLLWHFGRRALLLHLGMTGKWSRGAEPPFAKVGLHVEDGATLWFSDPRLLGGMVPTSSSTPALTAGLGPDAFRDPFPRLMGRRAVKVALLDQALLAGLGNLHAAEALWRAGIHPETPCNALSEAQVVALARGIREQLAATLDLLGDGDEIRYVEESGAPNPFPLYQRGGEPCPRCRTPIASMVQAARTTWWCPGCQR